MQAKELFQHPPFLACRVPILCGYKLEMSHLVEELWWKVVCLQPKYRSLEIQWPDAQPHGGKLGGVSLHWTTTGPIRRWWAGTSSVCIAVGISLGSVTWWLQLHYMCHRVHVLCRVYTASHFWCSHGQVSFSHPPTQWLGKYGLG